ncbi:MAG: anhydro-N-acetylmuramic acid kinase [Alphaproteobacteria bacterium]|nr:anhydro-N-acetylmuramic acid kinase [Alphaproteobacteria bacterium]
MIQFVNKPKFLSFNFSFHDLYDASALEKLDNIFLSFLEEHSLDLTTRLKNARQSSLTKMEESALLIDLAPHVEDFMGIFFGIEKEIQTLQDLTYHLAPLYRCKRLFVQRQAAKAYSQEEAQRFDGSYLQPDIAIFLKEKYSDLAFARHTLTALEDREAHQEFLTLATRYAAWSIHQDKPTTLFRLPRKTNPESLFPVNREENLLRSPDRIQRKGFDCTTPSVHTRDALDQAHYCILCHNQSKDSCAKGLSEGLKGCPLGQKISEMNTLRTQGYVLGALAMIMVDNPMVAATGHRICNDCEKACIFQKQDPVDIPSIESETLDSILNLPWGVEIYSLLSRWNPLNLKRPFPKHPSGYRVLVAGMGPAGFTLAHYLLNEGHQVHGIDRFKIEPLPSHLSTEPIREWSNFKTPLSQRTIGGFGGVMEYGITPRWDKNYLDLVRLLLERRSLFTLQDRTQLGRDLSLSTAFAQGFDHVALCLGAGRSNTLSIPHEGIKGIIPAARFLVDLQLKGRNDLEIESPILVIGGGLTAVDTATEALAYASLKSLSVIPESAKRESGTQEKIFSKTNFPWVPAFAGMTPEERNCRATIVYRKTLQDSPAYRLNHKELQLAMAEGVTFRENATPLEILVDAEGHIEALLVQTSTGVESLPCRTLLVATGTLPPAFLEQEDLDERDGVLLSYKGEQKVSFFGDLNPAYEGNVVRAMASAKDGYPQICEALLEGMQGGCFDLGSEGKGRYKGFGEPNSGNRGRNINNTDTTHKRPLIALGLMSGTSGDGIDAALLETDGLSIKSFGPTHFIPYPEPVKKAILKAYGHVPGPEIAELERTITELHAHVVAELLRKAGLQPKNIEVMGFHGQTLYHKPPQRHGERGETHIIGDGYLLATLTQVPVIDQFRLNDIAHGGQGAPFVPLFHQALAKNLPKPLAIINIGGVANITWIGPRDDELIAFDTGPGNGLIDDWVRENTDLPWDENGKIAALGQVNPKLLDKWLIHAYFNQAAPKSLDRGTFKVFLEDVRPLPFEDGVATLTALTAATLEKALDHLSERPTSYLVAGGGAHNVTLLRMMADRLKAPITKVSDQGWDGDALEAQAFAYLAVRSLKQLPLSLPGTTGVPYPLSGGRLCLGSRSEE